MKESILASASGGVLGILSGIGQEIVVTLLLGIVGGIGGLIGKEIFNLIKRNTWKR